MSDGRSRLTELFVREKSRFLSYVRRQMRNLSELDAEDIVSEVTYSLLRRADIVGEIENLSAYVYRSLSNRVVDHQRSEEPWEYWPVDPETEEPYDPPDERSPHPDQDVQRAQLREHLWEALGRLEPEEREVWVATEVEGISFRTLSEARKEPLGTLLSRKSRAGEKLRRMLTEYKDYRLEK